MIFVIELSFDDNPARLEARPAHRELLGQLKERGLWLMAGPWADDSGALLIIELDSAEELDRLLDEDPYYRAPGVTVVGTRHWAPVIR
jgi:uncharacterized protein YciI